MTGRPTSDRVSRRRFLALTGLAAAAPVCGVAAPEGGAGFALQFDDGWPNWTDTVAPELKRVGGRATGFVCCQYVDSGRVSAKALRALQDEHGWEIGSHAYHHLAAPRYVAEHGLARWMEHELDASFKALRDWGCEARSLAFPFNALTPEIAGAVRERVETFRRAVSLAVAPGRRPDGSVPGTTLDIAQYTPVDIIKSWIAFAARKRQVLFLYGHRVLPDAMFPSGTVTKVSGSRIVADADVSWPSNEDMVLVPDPRRRAARHTVYRVISGQGREIRVEGDPGRIRPGTEFIMGPSYGTRLSDFRAILSAAAESLPFYTLHDIVEGKHRR